MHSSAKSATAPPPGSWKAPVGIPVDLKSRIVVKHHNAANHHIYPPFRKNHA